MGGINKPGKPKSKRQPVRLRHKIEKASAAKQRKARKEQKKNPEWRSKFKKDPGIPNLFPYKNRILAEIEETQRKKIEEAERRRADEKAAKRESKSKNEAAVDPKLKNGNSTGEMIPDDASDEEMVEEIDEDANPMAALLASARAAAKEYGDDFESEDEMDQDDVSSDTSDEDDQELSTKYMPKDGSRKAFDKVFKQVVEQADVILYVLDARDPEGTRSKEIERMVMAAASGGKRLILILNKIDLVPASALRAWLIYLRRFFPTIPLRASVPAPNARTFNHKNLTVQATTATLFKALKSFAAAKKLKRFLTVGVIGYPNVGKSSVINALTSRLGGTGVACPIGAEAGVTTSLRQVKLDNKLKLLDSPGIVFPSSEGEGKSSKEEEQARLILLSAIPPKMIEDPVPAVNLLLKRLSRSKDMFSKMLEVYDLPPLLTQNGDPTMDFLVQVARKRGRLGKGGVPNTHSAGMMVITDWRDGRIQGWMDPPSLSAPPVMGQSQPNNFTSDQKQIVTEWAAEFKIEGLWGDGREESESMEIEAT